MAGKRISIKLDGLGEESLSSFAAFCEDNHERHPWLYGALKSAIQSEIERRRRGSSNDPVLPLDERGESSLVLLSAADECLRACRWFLDLGRRRDAPLEWREQCLFLAYVIDQVFKVVIALLLEAQPGAGDTRAARAQLVN